MNKQFFIVMLLLFLGFSVSSGVYAQEPTQVSQWEIEHWDYQCLVNGKKPDRNAPARKEMIDYLKYDTSVGYHNNVEIIYWVQDENGHKSPRYDHTENLYQRFKKIGWTFEEYGQILPKLLNEDTVLHANFFNDPYYLGDFTIDTTLLLLWYRGPCSFMRMLFFPDGAYRGGDEETLKMRGTITYILQQHNALIVEDKVKCFEGQDWCLNCRQVYTKLQAKERKRIQRIERGGSRFKVWLKGIFRKRKQ